MIKRFSLGPSALQIRWTRLSFTFQPSGSYTDASEIIPPRNAYSSSATETLQQAQGDMFRRNCINALLIIVGWMQSTSILGEGKVESRLDIYGLALM